jgi:uncharacterized protein YdaU (DUF1376 family)
MSSERVPAEWFWCDRWMGSSAFLLPLEARGLYREMLTQAWRRGAQLPNDLEAIRRAIGSTEKEWRRSWPAIARFWRVEGDALVNDTQIEIYQEAQTRMIRASARGRKAWLARTPVATQAPTQVGTQVLACDDGLPLLKPPLKQPHK